MNILSFKRISVLVLLSVLLLAGCTERFDEPSGNGQENSPELQNPDLNPGEPDIQPDPEGTENPEQEKPDSQPLPGEVWAKGVSRSGGWYDVNKMGDGRTDWGDAVMCWAASTANMLQWWIDNYVSAGNVLPAELPQGPGKDYQLRIFEIFREQWNNMHGCQADLGIRWFMTGDVRTLTSYGDYFAQPEPGCPGGFFNPFWFRIGSVMKDDYTADIQGYYLWDSGFEGDHLAAFTRLIENAFKEGMAGLSINAGNLHAITLWGYATDEKGHVCRIFVSDSDDMLDEPQSVPRIAKLQEYNIAVRNNEVGILDMAARPFIPITNIYPLRLPQF